MKVEVFCVHLKKRQDTGKSFTWNGILLPKFFWPTVRKIVLVIEKNFWNSRLNAKNLQIYKLRQTFEWANVNPSNCLTRSNVVNILVTDASGIRIGDWLNCTVQIHLRWCKYLGKKRRKKKLDSYLFINTGTLLP